MTDKAPSLAEMFGLPVPDALECREAGPYQGKKYPRRELTQVEQGFFSLWLEQEASAWVERQTHLPPDALRAHRDGVRADAWAGRFHFYSEASLARQNTIDGAAKLLSVTLLADGHAEADHEFCKRLVMAEAEGLAAKIGELAAAGDPKARAALDLFRSLTSMASTFTGSKSGTSKGSSRRRSTGRKKKSAG
jgi:hypothetical protein